MKRMFIIAFTFFLIQGCQTSGHKLFYAQAAPTKYPPTDKVVVFEYFDADLKDIYDLIFSDFLVIGKSGFIGRYEPPSESASFARSIGADVFIATSKFQETRTSFRNYSTPSSQTTFISGHSGSGSFSGAATTYGTQTITRPIYIEQYHQRGIFLRNVNNVNPLWERTATQYKKTGSNELDGIWFNENYKINAYRSGEQIVAFIVTFKAQDQIQMADWKPGQLKFIYGIDSGAGVYLMSDKAPMPARIGLNKFGHLEVSLIATGEIFSFARK